ncbi:MAG: hypothetical protein H6974_14765 [Gammaproteobacteria bacterium]|nr:hypothetical protein [Gammaproteobacteria bacterium]MCP5198023.1 hypothetical protein [Gammaproteobacteria bacterium]
MSDPCDWESHDEVLSALYRTTRNVEPPTWLDESILTTAHTAVATVATSAMPRAQRRGIRFWAMPVALVATIFLSVGIVRLARETGEKGWPIELKVQSAEQPAAETDVTSTSQAKTMAADRVLLSPPPPVAPATRMPQMAPLSAAPPTQERESPITKERQQSDNLQIAPAIHDEGTRPQRKQILLSPEAWLAKIAELRRQGRLAEAKTSLAEFRRRYPDYPQPTWEETD